MTADIIEIFPNTHPEFDNHRVFKFIDDSVGLVDFFALHRMIRSPLVKHIKSNMVDVSLIDNGSDGGTRIYPYQNEHGALTDALRLSKGMTYKSALAGLDVGGGKAVIIGDPKTIKTEAFLRAYGKALHAFNMEILIPKYRGVFMTGEDSGILPPDVDVIGTVTPFVFGKTDGPAGDPSPKTVDGVVEVIKECLRFEYGSSALHPYSFAIQGVGRVGADLARSIYKKGGRITVSETDTDKLNAFLETVKNNVQVIDPDKIYSADAHVFVPCAMGAILNDETIPQLKCRIVAGSANNQLKEPRHADILKQRGIRYAPDFVVNAGGIIHVCHERYPEGYNERAVYEHIEQIPKTLRRVFEKSEWENISTHEAAIHMADEVLCQKEMAW